MKLSGIFSQGKFDACLDYQKQNLLYIFKESLVIKYNYMTNVASQPISLNILYPGLPIHYQKGNFDALLRINDSQIAIFKNNIVALYNEVNHTIDNSLKVNEYWPGLTSIFSSGRFTAAIKIQQNSIVLFKDELYAIYTPDNKMAGPFNIIPNWRGLKVPFIQESQECLIYNEQISNLTKMKNTTPNVSSTEIDKHINSYQQLADRKCNFISYANYLKDLEAKLAKLEMIKKKIISSQTTIEEKQRQVSQINPLIANLNNEIASINRLINIEKSKTCQADQKCLPKITNNIDNRQCTSQMLLAILKNKGLSGQEINKIQPYLEYQRGIYNFDIKVHPDFYKYSKIQEIKNCAGVSRSLPIDTKTSSQTLPQSSQPNAINNAIIEKQAMEIFAKALAQYKQAEAQNQSQIEKDYCPWLNKAKSEAARLGLQLNQEQLKLFALGLRLISNLEKSKKLSFETANIAKNILNNPHYKQLLTEIEELNSILAMKKALLIQQQQDFDKYKQLNLTGKIEEIIKSNRILTSEINKINFTLSQKVPLIYQFK